MKEYVTLKLEGKLNGQAEITVKYINERYTDRDARSNLYETWDKIRKPGGIGEGLGEDFQRGQGEKTEGENW